MRALKFSGLPAALCALVSLAGCASTSGGGDPADVLGNLAAFNSLKAPPVPENRRQIEVDCPIVQVADGQSSYRAFAGADRTAAGVKYQYSIGDVARECIATTAGQIELRIGVSGYVLAGPSGASGAFNVPIKIVIRREADQSVALSKVYRVPTAIPPGDSQATFSHVTETLNLPYLRPAADEDYSIYIGFDGAGGENKAATRPQRRRRG